MRRALRFAVVAAVVCAAPILLHAQGDGLTRRTLTRDTVIDSVPCARHEKIPAEFHANGRLAGCFLARPWMLGGATLPTASWIDFTPTGRAKAAWLAKETLLAGVPCRGEGFKAWHTQFHERTGRLRSCFPAREVRVNEVPCMQGTFLREVRSGSQTVLALYDDGTLKQCLAARDASVGGVTLRKWKVVTRDSAGTLRSGS